MYFVENLAGSKVQIFIIVYRN